MTDDAMRPPLIGEPPHLFVSGEFTAHSGDVLPFKIDCDALTDADLDTLAAEFARRSVRFREVHGIPRGGIRFAAALARYATGSSLDPLLIVDDVLTTGASMATIHDLAPHSIGVVIFARGPCPPWVTPLFQLAAAEKGDGWPPIETGPIANERDTGHGASCAICQEPCDAFAGNPSRWPVHLANAGWHHVGCVTDRLRRAREGRWK